MLESTIAFALRARLPLEEIPPAALAALASIGQSRSLAPGEHLFHEGDPAEFLFVVEEGALVATKRSEDGAEVELRELGSGEIGGLTSMYVEKTRSATLQARAGPTTCGPPTSRRASGPRPWRWRAAIRWCAPS
jgi:CRP-like cAMP-binding protein